MLDVLLIAAAGAAVAKLTEIGVDAYRTRRTGRHVTSLARYEDVLRWGWDARALLRRLIKLDYQLIGALTHEREGSVDQWAPVFAASPHTWTLLTTRPKHIVGYYMFVALGDQHFARAKAGLLLDSQITEDVIAPLDMPGVYNLYFVLLAVEPPYRGQTLSLFDDFFQQLEFLASRGIFFREICANAYSIDGQRWCRGFGMSALCQHSDFGTVYHLPLAPWPRRLNQKRVREVSEQYAKYFGPLHTAT